MASDATSASDEERLAPGGFGLRHAFPQWFARPERSTDSSIHPSRNTSRSTGQDAGEGLRFKGFDVRSLPDRDHSKHSIADVLKYVKRAFSDEAFLDQLPSEAAVNAGAWKAWRAHRRTLSYDSGRRRASIDEASAVWKDSAPQVTKSQAKHPDEWSWDGVWEARVRKGIDTSVSDHVLFGAGDDEVVSLLSLVVDPTDTVARFGSVIYQTIRLLTLSPQYVMHLDDKMLLARVPVTVSLCLDPSMFAALPCLVIP